MGLKITTLTENAVEGVLDEMEDFDMRRSGDVLTARVGDRHFTLPARECRSESDMRACAYSVLARYRTETKSGRPELV